MAPEIYKNIDENILDENIGGLATKALNAFYRGDPKYIFPNYNEEKCRGFVKSLFKCMCRADGKKIPMDSSEKKTIADLVRTYPVEDLFAIFDMGEKAMKGSEEARLDLVKWYSSASYRGISAGAEKRNAYRILQRYRN
jgi:hypothetical protein